MPDRFLKTPGPWFEEHYARKVPEVSSLLGDKGFYSPNKYFASNQGLIFIGPYFIDEIVSCSYRINQSKVPVYGYNSMYYDTVAAGKVLVDGQFTINYVDSNYLFGAIHHFVKNKEVIGNRFAAALKSTLYSQGGYNGSILNQTLKGTEYDPDVTWLIPQEDISKGERYAKELTDPQMIKLTKMLTSRTQMNAYQASALKSKLRDRYWGNDAEKAQTKGSAGFMNMTGDEFRNEQNPKLTQARPDQYPPFTLTVAHGNPSKPRECEYRIIQHVNILSVQQECSPSGTPQLETYTFFARSIDF